MIMLLEKQSKTQTILFPSVDGRHSYLTVDVIWNMDVGNKYDKVTINSAKVSEPLTTDDAIKRLKLVFSFNSSV